MSEPKLQPTNQVEREAPLKTEGCGTQNPELEFQGLKPREVVALNV